MANAPSGNPGEAIKKGIVLLRNSICEGTRALILTNATSADHDVDHFQEQVLTCSLKSMEPPIRLVDFADDDPGRLQLMASGSSVILFVAATLPRTSVLLSPTKLGRAQAQAYQHRSHGGGGVAVTWEEISTLLGDTTPTHASAPAPSVNSSVRAPGGSTRYPCRPPRPLASNIVPP